MILKNSFRNLQSAVVDYSVLDFGSLILFRIPQSALLIILFWILDL